MADFNAELEKITDPELKASLKTEYDKVNRERGTFGAKLIEKDGEIIKLKETTNSYSSAFDLLKSKGVEVKDIPKMLEKFGIQKSLEDDNKLLTNLAEEQGKSLKELTKERDRLKAERAIGTILADELTKFVDKDNKPIKIAKSFIDENKLYDVSDLTNETVLREKTKTVLQEALAKQTEVLKDVGFVGVPAHQVSTQQGHQTVKVDQTELKKIMKEQGPAAAIAAMHQLSAESENK